MAFPTVVAVNGGNQNVNVAEHTVNLPSGISSGHLLLVFFVNDGGSLATFPEGWTQLFDQWNSNYVRFCCYYRVADSTEGASITVTTSGLQRSAHTSYRITGYSGTPGVGTVATGTDANPNPPNLSPSWGAEDTLWFAAEGNDGSQTVSAYPADYTDGRNDSANNSQGAGVGTARRELNAASENPGTFALSASEQWVANTIAIQPADGVAYYHGLKVQGEAAELALCDVGINPLRFRKGGTTYGIELVATDDPNASRIRIKTPTGIKALRKYT